MHDTHWDQTAKLGTATANTNLAVGSDLGVQAAQMYITLYIQLFCRSGGANAHVAAIGDNRPPGVVGVEV
jgi:hypothetical protein